MIWMAGRLYLLIIIIPESRYILYLYCTYSNGIRVERKVDLIIMRPNQSLIPMLFQPLIRFGFWHCFYFVTLCFFVLRRRRLLPPSTDTVHGSTLCPAQELFKQVMHMVAVPSTVDRCWDEKDVGPCLDKSVPRFI